MALETLRTGIANIVERIRPRGKPTYLRYGDRPSSADTPNFMVEGDKLLGYYKPGTKVTHARGALRGGLKELWYPGVEEDFDNGYIGSFNDIRRIRIEKGLDRPKESEVEPSARLPEFTKYDEGRPGGSSLHGTPEYSEKMALYTKKQEEDMAHLGEMGLSGLEQLLPQFLEEAQGTSPLEKLAMRSISGMSKPYQPRYSLPREQGSGMERLLEVLSDPDVSGLLDPMADKLGPLVKKGIQGIRNRFSR